MKNLSADIFHSALFSLHDITSHRSHYQHLTRSSILTSTNHRCDIHTNIPWVHHSSESVSSMCMGLLMKTRGRSHMQEKSCPPVKAQGWCFLRNAVRVSECVCVCKSILTLGGKPAPSALGYHLQKVEIKHIKPSVLYLQTNKRKKMAEHQDGRHAKQSQSDHQSINQWGGKGNKSQYKLVRLSKTTTGAIKIVLKWQIY